MTADYNPHLGYFTDVMDKYIKLVHYAANKHKVNCNASVGYEDLVSEGMVGLLKAFQKYDPTRFENVSKFSTFAMPYIRGIMAAFVRDKSQTVRPPRALYEIAGKIMSQDLHLLQPEEIAETLEITPERVIQTLEYMKNPKLLYLDQPVDMNEQITILDTLSVQADESSIFVNEFLSTLSVREREAVVLRMNGSNQRDIGDYLGVSQVHISRVFKAIGEKLKNYEKGIRIPRKEERSMSTQTLIRKNIRQESKRNTFDLMEGVEWYTAVAPAEASIGVNATGIHLNGPASKMLSCIKGDRLKLGFNSDKLCLILFKSDEGQRLSQAYGTNGNVCLNSKRLGKWLASKNVARKRYVLQFDETHQAHYIQLEKEK